VANPKTPNPVVIEAAQTLVAEYPLVTQPFLHGPEIYFRHDDGSYSFAEDLLRFRARDLLQATGA